MSVDRIISLEEKRTNKHLEKVADIYYYHYINYGVIAASIFAMDHVTEDERDKFIEITNKQKKKYGLT